ncbi:transcriptional repressor NrdR [Ectothiorhodosinus mongolicus]|uniref:Transcriptional repressor NrdR n=1 Tax=Ectothiorhodosinus mongolicus TaxID=233100 RepID=A0A1R3W7C0_9GAMM|nr:transcriptional regulator NrdR [Ectothiorhodosinus mongolicus]ULX57539.1 transcriptional regulator NrdR [Ectothiorhodosinus mongolicus]SIT72706.1 transcriptional repressor NrdR [Ectothiorhodosinus mongolicus]
MKCPFCGSLDTRVVDSRLAGMGEQIRRRRECADCGERFTSFETAEISLPRVVKRDGSREPFNEDKLRAGMTHALEKRPVSTDDTEAAVLRIKRRLSSQGEREVPAKRIGEWVMEELRELDQVAYIRFASVYLSFEDIQAFREAIEGLEEDSES